MKEMMQKWAWFAVVLPLLLLVYVSGIKNELVFDDFILADGTLFSEYGHLQAIKPRLLSYSTYTWVLDLFGEGWWVIYRESPRWFVSSVIGCQWSVAG
mgnify:CR=1 FL=1